MKKLLILLLLSSMITAGCNKETGAKADIEKNEQPVQQEITYVKTIPAESMNFTSKLSLPGVLKPREEVMVSAKASGAVQSLHGEIGSSIKKDQLLCKIDDTLFQLQFNKAATALNMEKIKIENAEKTYQRMKSLYENQAIAQTEYESAENQYLMAKELLELAQNDYDLAKENLAYTNIYAPISGAISMKDVAVGENIGPGKTLFTIVDVSSLYVEAGISEKDIGLIKLGQQVLMKVDALEGQNPTGKITSIGPVPIEPSKTYPIKVLVDNRNNQLKAGMFATIEIVTENKKAAVGVSKEAVIQENGKSYVFVKEEGKAIKKEVSTGMTIDGYIEITGGIQTGEEIIIVGQEKLVDGAAVEAK
ncbi:efflux RND transporter periplasmic adaptor subunit [Geosporobacter ferrireducens]|uniref:Uncharacterized protein n=1 Tax=Geosporobacter ferrireducens TaxID=1424294 RepID=A0A1D8GHW2_9FIRM|nr:efflux RND transporter periplasmic adaptor subunit [Geosporobacter ferrireducens]AOT70482.1 hypothetical protein Gferi_13385 [Geosporobacter ferrireducens]MTI57170.1 efflux RND transporter periplasmic adaptor subunit [Geosporobacter ferrireducens]